MKKLLFSFSILLLYNWYIVAQNELKTKSIAVFKDGTSFVIKQGAVKTTNGVFQISEKDFPEAKFGSFWIHSPDLQNVVSYIDTLRGSETYNATNQQTLIKPNVGKKVQIKIVNDTNLLDGVIEEVIGSYQNDWTIGEAMLFRTKDAKWLTIPLNQIERIYFSEKPILIYKIPFKRPVQVLEVAFKTPKTEQYLDMMYLQHGISWTPFYLLELQNDTDAKLTLRAEVVNQSEKIEKTDVNFVVGVPNFKFANSLSKLIDFTNRVYNQTPQYNNYHIPNIAQTISNSFIANDYARNTSVSNEDNSDNENEGKSIEDLYFYTLKDFSLPKNGRGHYQLFSHELKYEDIYECNLEPTKEATYYSDVNYNFSQQDKNKVVHAIKLKNTTPNPFTSASVMVVSNKDAFNQPLGQDVLNFTSKNTVTYIKITESTDLRVKQKDKILSKESKIFSKYGHDYYKVKVENTITLNNFKNKKAKFEIRRSINGILDDSDLKWQIENQKSVEYSPNTNNHVCWELELKPGEEKSFTYRYYVYTK